jgi:hypothetical protein
MARRSGFAWVGAMLIFAISSLGVAGSTTAQGARVGVKGFPFIEVGKFYRIEGYSRIKVTKDLGNGWVATEIPDKQAVARQIFMNLNQVSFIWEAEN